MYKDEYIGVILVKISSVLKLVKGIANDSKITLDSKMTLLTLTINFS